MSNGNCSVINVVKITGSLNLRGEMLHLFTCAYNKDVELYEAMTWVRAYENYGNVVLTNHGQYGGSFAWSPRHGRDKAIVRLHGSKLNLVADVCLPVRRLFQAQQHRLQESIDEAIREWLEPGDEKVKADKDGFKTPPPGYRREQDA